jgi:MFS family permease
MSTRRIWTFSFTGYIFMTVVICAAVSAIIPVMPNIMRDYDVGPGFLTAAFVSLLIGRFIASIFSGYVLLRIKAHQLLFIGFVLHATTMFLLMHADNGLEFTVLRFVEGIFEGIVSVVLQDIVIALSKPEDRGIKMGYMQSAYAVGFIAGPLATSMSMQWFGVPGVFGLVIAFMLISIVWLMLIYKELSANMISHPPQPISFDLEFIKYLPHYGGPILQRVLVVSFSLLLPLFLVDAFQLAAHQVAYFYLGSALITAVAMPLSGRLSKNSFCGEIVFGAMALMGLAIVGMGLSTSTMQFVLFYGLEIVGFVMMAPNAMKIFADKVADHKRRSEIVGTSSSFREAANMIVILTLVPLYEYSKTAPWLMLGAVSLLLAFPYLRKTAVPETAEAKQTA